MTSREGAGRGANRGRVATVCRSDIRAGQGRGAASILCRPLTVGGRSPTKHVPCLKQFSKLQVLSIRNRWKSMNRCSWERKILSAGRDIHRSVVAQQLLTSRACRVGSHCVDVR